MNNDKLPSAGQKHCSHLWGD